MKHMKKALSIFLAVLMLTVLSAGVWQVGAVSIPGDAMKFNGHYYKVFDESKTWTEAKAYCESLGGHLVTVTSEAENDFIYSIIENKTKNLYWLGANDVKKEGVWEWVTGEIWTYSNWCGGAPDNHGAGEDYLEMHRTNNENGMTTEKQWNDTTNIATPGREWYNLANHGFVCEWENIYNLGEETYSFENFDTGYCFGMAVTSSGYYLGNLSKVIIGGSDDSALYSFDNTIAVRLPIYHYFHIQGPGAEQQSMVAGGNIDLNNTTDTIGDWNACVDYVKDHSFDNEGSLNVGMWYDGGGGHAVNFLYYAEVDGQDRIYVYDNNIPEDETYYYLGADGLIYQAPRQTAAEGIIGLDLMDVENYFSLAEEFPLQRFVYAMRNTIAVENAKMYNMKCNSPQGNRVMFELPADINEVTITPLVENASFTYMDKTYTFGAVDEDTYGVLSLMEGENETGSFEVVNEPVPHTHTPAEAVKENVKDASCTEGGSYDSVVYCVDCGDALSRETVQTNALGHTAPDANGDCTRCHKHIKDVTPPQTDNTGKCHWCGKTHEGFFQKIIGFFHNIFAKIFGNKY